MVYEQSFCRGATKSCGCLLRESTRKRMSKGWAEVFSKEFLKKEHLDQKKSLRQIAKEQGCSLNCVVRYMHKHDLQANDPMLQITGQKFDRLTVIKLAHTKNWESYWEVECECGNRKIISGKSLVRRSSVSCGCWNREKCWRGVGELSFSYWSRIIKGASKRNIEFNLDINDAWKIYEQQGKKCALSGVDLVMDRHYGTNARKKSTNIQTASLDRIDSQRGYCTGNVQWLHTIVNRMKSDLSQDDFVDWCAKVNKASDCNT